MARGRSGLNVSKGALARKFRNEIDDWRWLLGSGFFLITTGSEEEREKKSRAFLEKRHRDLIDVDPEESEKPPKVVVAVVFELDFPLFIAVADMDMSGKAITQFILQRDKMRVAEFLGCL